MKFFVEWSRNSFQSGDCIELSIVVRNEAGVESPISTETHFTHNLDDKSGLYSDANCSAELGSLSMGSGQSRMAIYYQNRGHGKVEVNVGSGALSVDSQISVDASQIGLSIPPTIVAGEKTEITIQLLDASGSVAPSLTERTLRVSGVDFFASADSDEVLTEVTLKEGGSEVKAFIQHNIVESKSVSVDSASLVSAQGDLNMTPAPAALLTMSGKANISAVDCEPYTVASTDAFGNANTPAQDAVVSLGADARFYSDSNCQNQMDDPKVTLGPNAPSASIYLVKGKAETFTLAADDAPTSGLRKVEKEVVAASGAATQIIVDSSREIKALTCNTIRVYAADAEGNPAGVAAEKKFNVLFKSPVNDNADSTQARFTVSPDCSGDQFAGLTGTFRPVANTNNEVSFGMIATEGDVVMSLEDQVPNAFPTVDTAISVNSICGEEKPINFPAWGVTFSNGKLTVQGNTNSGYIRVGYTSQANVFVMNRKPSEDPTFSSAVRIYCVNEVEVKTGTGAKEVDLELGYIQNVESAGRLDGKVTVTSQGNGMKIVGSQFNDLLIGSAGADLIIGRGGNDRIYGNGGADHVYGGTGHDVIELGTRDKPPVADPGDMLVYGGSGGDNITIYSVYVSGSITINGDGLNEPVP